MRKTKALCDIILSIGIVLIILGLIIPHALILGTHGQGMNEFIKRTTVAWSFGCTGFSFVLLSSVFKLFLKNVEKDLNEIKYRLKN